MDKEKIRIPKDVLDGLEAVRRSGKTNMFDVPRVIELAFEMGHDTTAFWVYENKGLYSRGIFQGFEAEDDGTTTSMIRLFVYGTLKRGFCNHDRYCRDAVSIEEATVRGRLYVLPSGIPVLEVPEENVLALGSSDPMADAHMQASMVASRRICRLQGWQNIQGEIIAFERPLACIPQIDRLEGFTPDGRSLYIRVLIPACDLVGRIMPVWCYVSPDYMLASAVPMLGDSWP